ncbi:MAG: CobW family GTP-binding protein [Paracoccaceae bacterium]
MTSANNIPVSVIGGYLGSGKTTLINQLLRNADGRKLAVLVNEFGALPIDADLIEAQSDTMISISGGCVCCSYGNDLIQALLEISKLESAPDHILIESSGVALPGAIAASVSINGNFEIAGIITVVDSELILEQASNEYIGDTIERQLGDSDIVLLNKCDLVDEVHLAYLESWLVEKALYATAVRVTYASLPNSIVLQDYVRDTRKQNISFNSHTNIFESQVIEFSKEYDANIVAQKLADPEFNLLRSKGFVPTPSGLQAIQTVGRRWSVTDAPPDAKPGVVVIAEKLNSKIHSLIRIFNDE